MKLKIIKGKDGIGKELLQIESDSSKIAIAFGDEKGYGDPIQDDYLMIDGLTTGLPSFDAIFIMRNPENCNLINYALKDIPIYMDKKLMSIYETCLAFEKLPRKENIRELNFDSSIIIKDLKITSIIIDSSNYNTHFLEISDQSGKSIVISGDFRNYDGKYGLDKLKKALTKIGKVDIFAIDGKYLGKSGPDYISSKEMFEKFRNIMKFYKQVFVIQSETDLMLTSILYQSAIKTKKIFIENVLGCNLATSLNGKAPSPFTDKKVYSYTPLAIEREDFEFKKKYIAPFYISSAINKMKSEDYVMSVTKDMYQDIQVFEKEESLYDACLILTKSKNFIKEDKELEDFIIEIKGMDLDYYEVFSRGKVNFEFINKILKNLRPDYVIPIDFCNEIEAKMEIPNLKILKEQEQFSF